MARDDEGHPRPQVTAIVRPASRSVFGPVTIIGCALARKRSPPTAMRRRPQQSLGEDSHALCRPKAERPRSTGMLIGASCVRIRTNKVVACVRCHPLLPTIRPQDARQSIPAQQISQLEGLAVAIPWGFESPLPHFTRFARSMRRAGLRRSAFALRARPSGTSPPFRTNL